MNTRFDGHTKGPLRWFGYSRLQDIYLATIHRGRQVVMGFERWGMRSAQPTFQVHHDSELGIMKKAQELLKDFDPEVDFLLWPNSGDPAALWTCCFALVTHANTLAEPMFNFLAEYSPS